MAETVPFISTREEFIEQYRRLCHHIARNFVLRQQRKLEQSFGQTSEPKKIQQARRAHKSAPLPVKAEWAYVAPDQSHDLASAAILKLMRCPEKYWNQTGRNGKNNVVKRVIINAIIDEFDRQQMIFSNEVQSPDPGEDWFDTLPGRDGLADHTRIKFDSQKAKTALQSLTEGERLVIQFYFGLGCDPLNPYTIARKFDRTRYWAERRLESGLAKLRKQLNSPQNLQPLSQ
jgi:RNA polymerase sigma factor (sigma-70 family)